MRRIRVTTKPHKPEYEIFIGNQLLGEIGQNAREWLGSSANRIAVISNSKVFGLYGKQVEKNLKANGFDVSTLPIGDGERFKTLKTVERNLSILAANNFSRGDAIVALGGGVVGDVAGFTAAVYQRGIRFIYAPTTLLSQVDSSVGGKTGVNLPSAKNFVGSFHQPAGILTDVQTLSTLPRRELVSGAFECIKQAAVCSRRLFNQTVKDLSHIVAGNADANKMIELITAHCNFKAAIVKDDERESLNGASSRSRKILNFGHTVGHALEAVTNYRRFRHGEAVGIGMLVASSMSNTLGFLSVKDLEVLTSAVHSLGPLPKTHDLSINALVNAIGFDKKTSAGVVQWILLEGIGKPRIVAGGRIDQRVIIDSLRRTLSSSTALRS